MSGEPLQFLRECLLAETDECIPWPFAGAKDRGRVRFERKVVSACRLICTWANGDPSGTSKQAAHSCGNGHLGCVNPRHLRWATPRENSEDKDIHRRQRLNLPPKESKPKRLKRNQYAMVWPPVIGEYRPAKKHKKKGVAAAWIVENAAYLGHECLIWPFPSRAVGNTKGRGSLTFRGFQMLPSRAMCIEAHGYPPLPDDDATHTCGKGHLGCVHPAHLVWASRQQNMHDKIRHGTFGIKLTVENVREIRAANSNERLDDLGRRYGVTGQMVRDIRRRKAWAALE